MTAKTKKDMPNFKTFPKKTRHNAKKCRISRHIDFSCKIAKKFKKSVDISVLFLYNIQDCGHWVDAKDYSQYH